MRTKEMIGIFVTFLVVFSAFIVVPGNVQADSSGSSDTGQWKYMKISIPSHEFSYVAMFFVYNEENSNSNAVIDGNNIYLSNDSDFPFDVRFCYEKDPSKVLPQFADHSLGTNGVVYNKTVTLFYVKIPANLTTMYLFYNHTEATFYSDGSAVFDLFDDFNSDNDLQNYNILKKSATYSVNANMSYLYVFEDNGQIKNNFEFISNKFFTYDSSKNQKVLFVAKFKILVNSYPASIVTGVANDTSPNVYIGQEVHDSSYGYETFMGAYYVSYDTIKSSDTNSERFYLNEYRSVLIFNTTALSYKFYNSPDTVQYQSSIVDDITPSRILRFYLHAYVSTDSGDVGAITVKVDYMAAAVMQNTVNTYNETGIGTMNYVPPDNSSSGAGLLDFNGAGGIMGYLHSIANFAINHILTIIFAVLAATALFNGKFKAFFILALLATVSYFYLDSQILGYVHNIAGGG